MKGLWAILAALVLVALCLFGFSAHYLPLMRFTSEGWRQGGGEDTQTPVRLQMAEWLTRSRQLDGLTRSEVFALLGPTQRSAYSTNWDLAYRLGPERGLLSIDSEWLVIRFGGDGRVSEYRIERD